MRTKLFLESTQNQRCFEDEFCRWINADKSTLNQPGYHVDQHRHVIWTYINIESTLSVCWVSLFQNITLKDNFLPKRISAKFPRRIPYDYSCIFTKDTLMERLCKDCGLYFRSIKPKQNHSPIWRSKTSDESSDKQSTEVHVQKGLLCTIAFQELEWYNIHEFDFDGVENDIPEITHGPEAPVLDNIEPVWTDA